MSREVDEGAAMATTWDALAGLVRQAIDVIEDSRLDQLRGVAIYDSQKDDAIKSLEGFDPAVAAIASIPLVAARYGADQAARLAIQFVYEVGARLVDVAFDETVVRETWDAFCEELDTPEWIDRGVANVRNFQSEEASLPLGDGVTIARRSTEELASLGFNDFIRSQLREDVMGFGTSGFVMLIESRQRKQPSNYLGMDASVQTKGLRALGALRLLAPGDVGFGRMWFVRPMRFNVGIGGVTSTGSGPDMPGSPFICSAALVSAVPQVCEQLRQLEQNGYADAPGNLDLALRSFMATYDRWPRALDAQLLDSITALEAVLGTRIESSFRLASRVSALLAADDADRVSVFETVRGFYDARSEIVHGSQMSKKSQPYLVRVDDLRDMARRLLNGFVTLATAGGHSFNRSYFEKGLDAALLRSEDRDALRAAMALSG
jgi:hypothetical protein